MRWEIGNETDRIGQDNGAAMWQLHAAQGRVERGEQHILRQNASAGDAVEQRGFACIGVTDQRDDVHSLALATAPVQLTLPAHLVDLALEAGEAAAHEAAVRLQLGLAGAAGADASFEAFEVAPLAGEAREQVLSLGQLDLKTRLTGLGAAGEDIEDQGGAVEDLHL